MVGDDGVWEGGGGCVESVFLWLVYATIKCVLTLIISLTSSWSPSPLASFMSAWW